MKAGGCLILLLIIGAMAVELWFALVLAEWINPQNPEYLGAMLGTVVLTVVGVQLARWRMKGLAPAMMSGRPGPAVAALFGAILIALPGYLTAVPGLLLQLPPVQKLFGRVFAAFIAVAMQRAAKRMGGMGGFPGGFPGGMPGGGFPGGPGGPFAGFPPGSMPKPGQQVPSPDQRLRGGKVVDTTAERVDD